MKYLSETSIVGNKEIGGMKKEIDEGSLELSNEKRLSLKEKAFFYWKALFSVFHNTGEIAVLLLIIQAVAYHEEVGHGEAGEVDIDVQESLGRIIQERADFQAPGSEGLDVLEHISKGKTRADDIFHKQHVAVFDADIQILDEGDVPLAGLVPAHADGEEIHFQRHGQLPCEVGEEVYGSLEDADDHKLLLAIPGIDLRGHLGNTLLDLLLFEYDLSKSFCIHASQSLSLIHI